MKKHKHCRHELDLDAPPRLDYRKGRARWRDEWDEDADVSETEEDQDEEWTSSVGFVDLWAEQWSEPDSSQAGRWRRVSSEGPDRLSA